MVAEQLRQRLRDSAADLREIVNSLGLIASPAPSLCMSAYMDEIRKFDEMADRLLATCDLIDARIFACQLLENLLANSLDEVDYQGVKASFSAARLVGFQSYLSTTWAVCDSIIPSIAVLLFPKKVALNRKSPPNLLSLIAEETTGNILPSYYNSFFLLNGYGWPIAISYVIRNHFVHEGASNCGRNFFESQSVASEYAISSQPEAGWAFLEDKMRQNYSHIKQEYTRRSDSWPWHQDNLLRLLELCSDEIDEALSCLVGWSVGMAKLQARYLLERDISAVSAPP